MKQLNSIIFNQILALDIKKILLKIFYQKINFMIRKFKLIRLQYKYQIKFSYKKNQRK